MQKTLNIHIAILDGELQFLTEDGLYLAVADIAQKFILQLPGHVLNTNESYASQKAFINGQEALNDLIAIKALKTAASNEAKGRIIFIKTFAGCFCWFIEPLHSIYSFFTERLI